MKIGILTSGGDAPGMNATIINLIDFALANQHEVYLIEDGYEGLLNNTFFPLASYNDYKKYLDQSGSFIYSSRSLKFPNTYQDAVNNINTHGLDYLIVIGGDGSYKGVNLIAPFVKTIFIPASIDNDVKFSQYALGFASATNEIVKQFKKICNTTRTHKRIHFLEVMGHYSSALADNASSKAHPSLTLTYQNKLSPNEILEILATKYKQDKYCSIIVSEFIYNNQEKMEIIFLLQEKLSCRVCWEVLGYSQRGADVVSEDLQMAKEMAKLALKLIQENKFNVAILAQDKTITYASYDEINKGIK